MCYNKKIVKDCFNQKLCLKPYKFDNKILLVKCGSDLFWLTKTYKHCYQVNSETVVITSPQTNRKSNKGAPMEDYRNRR